MAHAKTTGTNAASKAGRVLASKSATKAAKSAAASALSQRHAGKSKK